MPLTLFFTLISRENSNSSLKHLAPLFNRSLARSSPLRMALTALVSDRPLPSTSIQPSNL